MSQSLVESIGAIPLLRMHPNAKTFLDLGCGPGRVSRYAAFRGLNVLAIDRWRMVPERIRGMERVRYLQKDLHNWSPEEETWDIMVLLNVIQFLDRDYVLETFLPRLVTRLNPAGLIEIETFSPGAGESFNALSRYIPDEIVKSLKGLSILEQRMFEHDGPDMHGIKRHFHLTWVRARRA